MTRNKNLGKIERVESRSAFLPTIQPDRPIQEPFMKFTDHARFVSAAAFVLTAVFMLFCTSGFLAAADGAEKFYASFLKYRAGYVEKLEALAEWCDENGLEEQAAETRRWAEPEEEWDEIRVSPLPNEFWMSPPDAVRAKSAKGIKGAEGAKSAKSGSGVKSGSAARGKKSAKGNGTAQRSRDSQSSKRSEASSKAKRSSKAESGRTESGRTESGSAGTLEELESEWRSRFRQLRMTASNDYLKFARRTVSAGHVSFGFALLMQSLHENPDNEGARRILGYLKAKDGWQTPFEAMMRKSGNVWHEKYGWIPKKYLRRYEEGQRFLNGKWVSEAEDAEFRSTIERGWTVETGHFQIVTDASLEEGVRVGEELEELYRVWKQLFLNYYATEAQISALFGKGNARFANIPKHRVCLFRSHEEYQTYLSSRQMYVPGSVGVYVHRSTGEGVSCFVAGEEERTTMYHEVTHQLFEESCKTNPKNGSLQNFWVIEAAATFMESFHEASNGAHAVGGFSSGRMRAARIYFVNSKKFIPFEEFVRVNRTRWQNSPDVGLYYAQACGMAHFLVFYENGKYRDAFGKILFDVYSGRDSVDTLTKHTGSDWETLDREYAEFISQKPEEIAGYMIRE